MDYMGHLKARNCKKINSKINKRNGKGSTPDGVTCQIRLMWFYLPDEIGGDVCGEAKVLVGDLDGYALLALVPDDAADASLEPARYHSHFGVCLEDDIVLAHHLDVLVVEEGCPDEPLHHVLPDGGGWILSVAVRRGVVVVVVEDVCQSGDGCDERFSLVVLPDSGRALHI